MFTSTLSPTCHLSHRHIWACCIHRAFVQEMSKFSSAQFDPAAIGTAKRLPVESAMPGTTLELIPLQAFDSGGLLYGA